MDKDKAWLNEIKNIAPIKRNKHTHITLKHTTRDKTTIPSSSSMFNNWKKDLEKSNYHHVIDLHGLTQHEAFDLLSNKISEYYHAQNRVLLVITGKGTDHKPSVLRKELPRWLSESKISKYILESNHPAERDGGLGARYIILKKLR